MIIYMMMMMKKQLVVKYNIYTCGICETWDVRKAE